ncbi:hypothetical protein ACQ4LE_008729 [Meloidogyne hapla]
MSKSFRIILFMFVLVFIAKNVYCEEDDSDEGYVPLDYESDTETEIDADEEDDVDLTCNEEFDVNDFIGSDDEEMIDEDDEEEYEEEERETNVVEENTDAVGLTRQFEWDGFVNGGMNNEDDDED